MAARTAASTRNASASRPSECRSSSATLSNVPQGFAIPRPAMSGADPWMGSYKPRRPSPSAAEGSTPSEPASIEASSVRMSPNRFSVSTTSKSRGRRSRCIAAESTSMCSSATPGNSSRITRVLTSRHSREVSSTFDLST
jgi:hypothetical protein